VFIRLGGAPYFQQQMPVGQHFVGVTGQLVQNFKFLGEIY
jgi:hypothetical protein